MKRHLLRSASFCLFGALAACGGSSSSTPPPVVVDPNTPPAISASSDKSTVTEGQAFTLDASMSTDADGDALTYAWTQISGTTATISAPSAAQQNLTAPTVSSNETLQFQVQVSDGKVIATQNLSVDILDIQPQTFNSKPSPFFNNEPLTILKGLVGNSEGGFTAIWDNGGGSISQTSSQTFDEIGMQVGNQVDGLFDYGSVRLGGRIAKVLNNNGELLYILRSDITNGAGAETPESDSRSISIYSGVVTNRVSPSAYIYGILGSLNVPFSFDSVSMLDSVITVVTSKARDNPPSEAYAVDVVVTEPDGSSSTFRLDGNPEIISGSAIAPLQQNSFAAVYAINESEVSNLYLSRTNTNGTNITNRESVTPDTSTNQDQPDAVTLSSGNIFITWRDDSGTNGDNAGTAIKGRMIDQEGNFTSDEVLINTTTASDQERPHAVALLDNTVLVVWHDFSTGAQQIRGQILSASGEILSNELLIASDMEAQNAQAISSALLGNGKVVLGWRNTSFMAQGGSESSYSVILDPLGR